MSRLLENKLNPLIKQWPVGVVLTSKWLNEHGYYKQLVKRYCDNGWLKSLGKGAYARLDDPVNWQGAVKALQEQLNIPVHVGGLTALELYGIYQYQSLNYQQPTFYLFNTVIDKVVLPKWFQQHFTNGQFTQRKLFTTAVGLTKKDTDQVQLDISSPERAILETLSFVPSKITLLHAEELMEGLDRLRVDKVQELLNNCLSVKVKRLFLYLAEKCNLAFFDDLNLETIDLGSGKRVIGTGGTYNAKWLLSLPETNNINDQLEGDDE